MTLGLRSILLSLLFNAAEENDYLESLSVHSDAIGKHLGAVEPLDFIAQLNSYFTTLLKKLSKLGFLNNLTVAFDETYIPYYGKKTESVWIHGYTNKVKGATGSYKFMAASIVVRNQRFVISMLPMATIDNSVAFVDMFLARIKKYFHVSLVLVDRGFASKELAYDMEQQNQKYIALCPRWKNVKRYLEEGIKGICEVCVIRDHRREKYAKMQYVIEYDLLEYDWVFLTNTDLTGIDLVRAYKARWGIETTFRVMDHADIKSKSTNIVIRTFFFLISILLYNLWIEERENLDCTFAQFLDMIALASKSKEQLLQEFEIAKAKVGELLLEKEIADSFFVQFVSTIRPEWSNQGAKAPFKTVSLVIEVVV